MNPPEGYRYEQGLLWPDYDVKCAAVVFKMTKDLTAVLKHVNGRDTVVQAGGNCGVWPRALSSLFSRVVTFEPDKRNFRCLVENTRELGNVIAFNYAVGESAGVGKMDTPGHELDNCGALQFVPDDFADASEPNMIPMMRIDVLNLNIVDLLYLDIEGFEIPALMGAAETIKRCKPIIALEDKGLSERYGYKKDDVDNVLKLMGYGIAERIHKDKIFKPV